MKINESKIYKALNELKKSFKAKLILDVLLFIYYLASVIYSIIQFSLKRDPLVYNISNIIASLIGLTIQSCTLVYTYSANTLLERGTEQSEFNQ